MPVAATYTVVPTYGVGIVSWLAYAGTSVWRDRLCSRLCLPTITPPLSLLPPPASVGDTLPDCLCRVLSSFAKNSCHAIVSPGPVFLVYGGPEENPAKPFWALPDRRTVGSQVRRAGGGGWVGGWVGEGASVFFSETFFCFVLVCWRRLRRQKSTSAGGG